MEISEIEGLYSVLHVNIFRFRDKMAPSDVDDVGNKRNKAVADVLEAALKIVELILKSREYVLVETFFEHFKALFADKPNARVS